MEINQMTPEQLARREIEEQLTAAGWIVQDYKKFNPGAGLGIAVREYTTDTGPVDYALLIDRKPIGVIEAKPEGTVLSKVEDQVERYETSYLKWRINNGIIPFSYEATGVETRFKNNRDPKARFRDVFSFHQPETIQGWLKRSATLRRRLTQFPKLNTEGLWECQIRGIRNLEYSFAQNKPRALIQMATGSGKTFTAITFIYRLLKFADASRILFLVDTRNLGQQAEQELQNFTPTDDKRKFTELYNVQRLQHNFIDKDSQVCISTIQRMYSILRGEELDASAEDQSLFEMQFLDQKPKEVVYNPQYPIEFFDFIIIDECHRSIYNLWRQVLEYYDAFLIGLTATPDNRTFAFFNQNVVSEYSHEDAVADGVNVGYDIYTIETEITQKGATIQAEKEVIKNGKKVKIKQYVDKRSRMTRRRRWEQLDEDVSYTGKQLDRDVVNKSQIRTIIRTLKQKLFTEIFPNRKEVPKTLIFAKTDSHADDIIQIVREEFGEGNEFCKKITYNVKDEKPEDVLASFRTSYYPRIAVTVDMIATGTDIKPIECLIFMRDVKSKSYFEQMKGRGVRILKLDDLRRVTPSAVSNKTHFIIIDAVGVCKSVKTTSRSLERKRTVPLKDLMMAVAMNHRDEDTVTTLANRLARMDRQIGESEKERIKAQANDRSLGYLVHGLLDAYNPDKHLERAFEIIKQENPTLDERKLAEIDPTPEQIEQAKKELINESCQPFDDGELRELLEKICSEYDQIMDDINLDKLNFAGFDPKAKENAQELVTNFKKFIEQNKDEIIGLQFFYSQPYKRQQLTLKMIKELSEALQKPPNMMTIDRLWEAYKTLEQNKVKGAATTRMLTDMISLIRHAVGLEQELAPFGDSVNQRFEQWLAQYQKQGKKFTPEQMTWLKMMKDHIATSITIEKDDFDNVPFYEKGGLMKVWQLFGDELDQIIEEMNLKLVA